jgi:hypothetical protein
VPRSRCTLRPIPLRLNRGHNSIAVSPDARTGELRSLGYTPTRARIRALAIDRRGFLLAANQDGNSIVSFRINQETGELTPTDKYASIHAGVREMVKPVTVASASADSSQNSRPCFWARCLTQGKDAHHDEEQKVMRHRGTVVLLMSIAVVSVVAAQTVPAAVRGGHPEQATDLSTATAHYKPIFGVGDRMPKMSKAFFASAS